MMDLEDIKDFVWFATWFILVAFVLLGAIVIPIAILDYHSSKNACRTWQIETDRKVKFVSDLPFYWDCLVKTDSGWISGENLQQIETPNLGEPTQ